MEIGFCVSDLGMLIKRFQIRAKKKGPSSVMISGLILCSELPRMLVGGQLASTNPTDKTGQQKQGHTSHSIFQLLVTGSILPLLKPR